MFTLLKFTNRPSKGSVGPRPDGSHGGEIVAEAPKSLFELHAQGVELDLPASEADAEVQAPAGDVVESGDFLGEKDWVPVREAAARRCRA